MRTLALAALLALAASAAHAQETPPPAAGPYLLLQTEGDVIVLASMAERRPTAVGAQTTTIAFLAEGDAVLRGDSVTEADCARGLRRTGTIFVRRVGDPDAQAPVFTTAPGIDWEAPGPLDGPLMDYLCRDGAHDAAQVSPRLSTIVRAWRNGG